MYLNLQLLAINDTLWQERAHIDVPFPFPLDPCPVALPLSGDGHRITAFFEARRPAPASIRSFGRAPDFLPCPAISRHQLCIDCAQMAAGSARPDIGDHRDGVFNLESG